MTDIISLDSSGMGTYDTQVERAANILSVQLGALEYWPEGGIDLRYFLTETIQFQDSAFRSYLIQILATWGINVSSFVSELEALLSNYFIEISPEDNSGGMVAR